MTLPTDLSEEARELYFYTPNCAQAWAQAEHYFRNLERKRAKGTYDPALADKGANYFVETAAKEYIREFCDKGASWHAMFPLAVRNQVAALLMRDTEAEWRAGNYWGNKPSQLVEG